MTGSRRIGGDVGSESTRMSGSNVQRSSTAKTFQTSQSKQQHVRSQGVLNFERTTCMTPNGLRSVRLHPSTDMSRQMEKYRPRPHTASPAFSSQRETRDVSKIITRKPLIPTLSSPAVRERPSSSKSLIFTTRNSQCSPPDMYLHDDLRRAAKQSQRVRSRSLTDSTSSFRSQYTSSEDIYIPSPRSDIAYRFGEPIQRPKFVKKNKLLNHSELTMGQKQYIWGIARVYSVDQLKRLKQRQYQGTLNYEYSKRMVTKKLDDTQRLKLWKEYQMYEEFIKRYTTGLPKAKQSIFKNDGRSRPHRHSCIPWLQTKKEPIALRDRVILHDPLYSPDTDEEEKMPPRPRTAPPDGYYQEQTEDYAHDNDNDTDTDAGPASDSESGPYSSSVNEGEDAGIDNEDTTQTYGSLLADTEQKLHLKEPDDNYL